MLARLKNSLTLRQTAQVLSVVVVLTTAITGVEVFLAYREARAQLSATLSQWVESVEDTSSRAAYHVDDRQAEAVLDGLMKFRGLDFASIKSDLNTTLAERNRSQVATASSPLAQWLFGDLVSQQRELSFQPNALEASPSNHLKATVVGRLELRANAELVAADFIGSLQGRSVGLLLKFSILAGTLAIIFHRNLTRFLVRHADELARLDIDAGSQQFATVPEGHEADELGRVVTQTNELLMRVHEQRVQIQQQHEALAQRERVAAMGSMLAGVAHELNNPLAILMAQTELLAETATDEATLQRAEKILRPAVRCTRIVRSFLALARNRKRRKSVVDPTLLVADALELLAYQLRQMNVSVSVDVAQEVEPILVDEDQLGQALINLLLNAQHAVADIVGPRRILVEVDRNEEATRFTVSDNGPGIPPDTRTRVFDAFYTTKAISGGTGLGLSYSLSVVGAHGGTITIDDSEEGGAAVCIRIPHASLEDGDSPAGGDAPHARAPLTILVVEDEDELAAGVREALESVGHSVTVMTEVSGALEYLESSIVDLVVSDLRLPTVSGQELYDQALEVDPCLERRFVFMTGDTLSVPTRTFLEKLKLPWLAKPYALEALRRLVASFEPRAHARKTV